MSPNGDGQGDFSPFGDRLRTAAEGLGLTSAAMAQKLSITRGTMARYWHGERLPPAPLLFDMARLLDVDAHWLIRGRIDPGRGHLRAADNADWVEVPEYSLFEIDEFGKLDPISIIRMRKDWLYTSLGENSGLWLARLPARYDALTIGTGTPLFCKDHRSGERLTEGTYYLFRINGGIVMAPFTYRDGGSTDDAVHSRDLGNEEDQYQVVARVVGQLARPI